MSLSDGDRFPGARPSGADHGLVAGMAPVGLAGFDQSLRCTWANHRFSDLAESAPHLVVGRRWPELLPLTRARDLHAVRRVLSGEVEGADFLVVTRSVDGVASDPGPEVWRLHLFPLTDLGAVTGLGVVAADVTDDELRLAELRHRAEVDGLTGLLNRTTFHLRTERVAASRPDEQFVLLVVDVDDFKTINDTWGHVAGDAVLAETGRRLGDLVDDADGAEVAGRIGGDEFAVLLRATDGWRRRLGDLHTRLTRPVDLAGGLSLTPSVAVGHAPLTASGGVARAVAEADVAMYAMKRRRRERRAVAAEQDGATRPELDVVDPILDGACGLLMGTTGCDELTALVVLARCARASGQTLLAAAQHLNLQGAEVLQQLAGDVVAVGDGVRAGTSGTGTTAT